MGWKGGWVASGWLRGCGEGVEGGSIERVC